MSEPREITVDINVDNWTVLESHEFRRRVGVNPEYAMVMVQRAWNAAADEMRDTFGSAMDEEGWRPPEDFVPLAILNVDAMHLLGFAWIAHRRDNPDAAFEAWSGTIPVGELNQAFYSAMNAMVEAQHTVPLNRQQRRQSGRRSATPSPSATSSTGPSETSTDSPSASSAEPSTS